LPEFTLCNNFNLQYIRISYRIVESVQWNDISGMTGDADMRVLALMNGQLHGASRHVVIVLQSFNSPILQYVYMPQSIRSSGQFMSVWCLIYGQCLHTRIMHISADNRLNTTHSVDKKNKARDEQYPLDLANHREITKDSLLIYTIRTTGFFPFWATLAYILLNTIQFREWAGNLRRWCLGYFGKH